MRDSYKDLETLLALEEACDWRASVALLEIASDQEVLEQLQTLEFARAVLDAPAASHLPERSESRPQPAVRVLAAVVSAVGLLLLPGGAGGIGAIVGALGVGSLVGLIYPRATALVNAPT